MVEHIASAPAVSCTVLAPLQHAAPVWYSALTMMAGRRIEQEQQCPQIGIGSICAAWRTSGASLGRCRHDDGIPDVLQQHHFRYAAHVQYTAPAVTYSAPTPVVKYISPAPAVSYASPVPASAVSCVEPAPAGYATPAPVVEYISPAPTVSYVAPAPAVYTAPAPVVEYIGPAQAHQLLW